MGMESGKILEELQFLLEEDNRVITYKFVSANFDIHINEAKEHLQSLWKQCQGKGDDEVTATYFVSGLTHEEGDYACHKALVVTEDRLAAARGALSSVTSEHLYSLQRQRVCHTNVLFGADLQEQRADFVAYNKHGAISNPRAELIPQAELLKARQATTTVTSAPARPAPAKEKPPAVANQEPSEPKATNQEATGSNAGHEAAAPKQEKGRPAAAPKRGTIESMFAKTGSDKVKSPPKKPANVGMMASFLKKGAERPASPPPAKPEPVPARRPVSPDAAEGTAAASPTVRFGAKRGAGRQKRATKANGGREKKRRRIVALVSDSSDSSADEEKPEPEPEPEPEPQQVTLDSDDEKPALQDATPRHRRKLVSKTFLDDDGFMVTKKEYETCSESDSEAVVGQQPAAPAKEPAPASTSAPAETQKPKATSPHKTKQPNIMSFFKKK
ncbi:DNA polymerase delta subunit 3-like [Pollicipes pollicipes]|uniref:DNA polymerase delta subunit 3-like n=1 Tax=Pollicipes pollicipes TaxID=41117 RepID=UPI00188597E0|nr:DNA polymerase delta subunit 3-like [Pollicipes pollicipes]XP_037075548.1 DNA polymerase delta subunit 3-like [Pollicipes pollicipes]